jgi:hypothetical protein
MFRLANERWQRKLLRWHRVADMRRGWISGEEARFLEDTLAGGTPPVEVWKHHRKLVRPRRWRQFFIRTLFGLLVIGGMMLLSALYQ